MKDTLKMVVAIKITLLRFWDGSVRGGYVKESTKKNRVARLGTKIPVPTPFRMQLLQFEASSKCDMETD